MRQERGQASFEYLGVVAVVGLVLAALAVPALAGDALAGGVVGGLHRGLCLVGGGDCAEDRRPCVVAARVTDQEAHLRLVVVHLGGRVVLLREERSDGTVALTYLEQAEDGLEVSAGAGGRVRLGRHVLRAGTELGAELVRLAGEGRTWVVDPATADRLMARLAVGSSGELARRLLGGEVAMEGLPAPAQRSTAHGLRLVLGLALQRGAVGGSLELSGEQLAGSTLDTRTGRRTYLVRRRNAVAAALSLGPSGGAHGAAAGEEAYAVTVDASGRPVDLAILTAGELSGALDLPRSVQAVAGALGVSAPAAARRWETEAHLDLTDPASLEAARGFLAQVVAPRPHLGALVATSAALRRRLDDAAVVDARTYATSDDTTGLGADAHGNAFGVGAGRERRQTTARLLRAMQRGADGTWRRRSDCAGAG